MLNFFKQESQKQYNKGYLLPTRDEFEYENTSRADRNTLSFSEHWTIQTDSHIIKTTSDICFAKGNLIMIKDKKYRVDNVYTEDNDNDINSPWFNDKRTYQFINLVH